MEGMEAVAHKTPALKQQRDRARKAFSLIEAVFVLAVVGGVIGGIWGVTSSFMEDYKVSKTVADLQLIVRNVQGLISIRDAEAIGDVHITNQLIAAGVFPKDWVNSNTLKNPFGGLVEISVSPQRFQIFIHGLTPSSCIKFVVKITSIAATAEKMQTGSWANLNQRPSLGQIEINWSTSAWYTNTFPVPLDVAKNYCNKSSNYITLSYPYTRINN